MTTNKAAGLVSEAMISRALFFCPHDLPSPAKHRWMAEMISQEVQAALGVGGWRPMEEAPVGVAVLVYYKNALGKGRTVKAVFVARYTEEADVEIEHSNLDYHEERDIYYLPEGWYEQIDNWDEFSAVQLQSTPTTWHPLPPPPASKEESA